MAPKRRQSVISEQREFAVGDLVGAKVRGHPLWPARITDIQLSNGARKKYTVTFFQSNDSASTIEKIVPFHPEDNYKASSKKQSGLNDAYKLCCEEYNRIQSGTDVARVSSNGQGLIDVDKDDDGHVPMTTDEGDDSSEDLRIDESAEDKSTIGEITLDEDANKNKACRKRKMKATKVHLNEKKGNKKRVPCPKRGRLTKIDLKSESDVDNSSNLNVSEKTLIDPPKVNSSHNNSNNSLSKSTIDHNSRLSLDKDEDGAINPTIEKLKKKLDDKMQEKLALKMSRKEKKLYESASKKFPLVHEKLDRVLSLFNKLLEGTCERNITKKLELAHKDLKFLEKCIEILNTDYGRRQKDSIAIQQKLHTIVKNLYEVRDKNPDLRKLINRHKKVYRSKVVKVFIKEFAKNSDETMAERKENSASDGCKT